ncbi:hypothetical protein G7Z17_g8234 [Cylindrodendrum hubeiense]|uniref:Uncharacterized protein n=1 Tax=Cylindrodendrum hubeiense TaxID=595255 RepID=A0A9P5H414_9HYPO|nr:hypothetical protein G7Z17_g8234 [Cylindrodendrum hubeiense]
MKKANSTSSHEPRLIPSLYHCAVIAYPSVGGVIIGYFTGVELQWLGFPRSSQYLDRPTTAGKDKDEESLRGEDRLALRLLQLGSSIGDGDPSILLNTIAMN